MIVIYLGGGAMSGVFGAGVVAELEKANVYNKLEAVYGGSAGAMNAAFFLTKQTKMGRSIYWEDLTHDFIFPKKLIPSFIHRFIGTKNGHKINSIDIDYLFSLPRIKKLRLHKLPKIPFYTPLVNLNTKKLEYLDVREDPWNILRAAVSIVPYYSSPTIIKEIPYIDGAAAVSFGLKRLLKRHPKCRIIIVSNTPLQTKLLAPVRKFIEGLAIRRMFGSSLNPFANYVRTLKEDIEIIKKNSRVFAVAPKETIMRHYTSNRKKIIKLFKEGRRKGKEAIGIINN